MTGMMMKTVGAALLVTGLASGSAAARADAPATPNDIVASDADAAAPPIVLAYAGCGPYGHRGPFGACRPGGQWGGYVPGRSCPPGWHVGPYGRRCWPNRSY